MTSPIEFPVLRQYGRFTVVRDDLCPGGAKHRVFREIARRQSPESLIYAGPGWGGAQVAMTYVARERGIPSVSFVPWRKKPIPRESFVARLGTKLVPCRPGYLGVVKSRARAYQEDHGGWMVSWGVPETVEVVGRLARKIDTSGIDEVWVTSGSGQLLRALMAAWGDRGLRFFGVQVGAEVRVPGATIIEYPRAFGWRTKVDTPFPACRYYDAKGWETAQRLSSGRVLFWNVMRDHR